MASRPVSFRVPDDVDRRLAEIKALLGKDTDSEALVEMIRTYPLAWRPSLSPVFSHRPPERTVEKPKNRKDPVDDVVYGEWRYRQKMGLPPRKRGQRG